MNKTTQKVVIIDNISSPYVEQAIIILKDFSPEMKSKILADAEKIVRDYLEKIKTDDSDILLYNRPSKKKHKIHWTRLILLCTALSAMVTVIFKLIL